MEARGTRSPSSGLILEGWLEKLKDGFSLGKAWQRRWFRIEGDKLMYYKKREDLEHLGWIDLSSDCHIDLNVPETDEQFSFALCVPNRRYVLKATREKQRDTWVEALTRWSSRYQVQRSVSTNELLGMLNRSSPHVGQVQQMLDRVQTQEPLLNETVKQVEKFKQKAYALQELGGGDSDYMSLLDQFDAVQRNIRALHELPSGNMAEQDRQVALTQMVASQQKRIGQLEEHLFLSQVMSLKLNELLLGNDVNGIDPQSMWRSAKKAHIPMEEFQDFIQRHFDSLKLKSPTKEK